MKDELKKNTLAHGLVKRITALSGVSAPTVSKVLNGKPGVSARLVLKVVQAGQKVKAQLEAERAKSQKALADFLA